MTELLVSNPSLILSQERIDPYEYLRTRVARFGEAFFDKIDANVAQQIGFRGNILNELRKRAPNTASVLFDQKNTLTTKPIDPKLSEYMDSFSGFKFTSSLFGLPASYRIGNNPEFRAETPNGGFSIEQEYPHSDHITASLCYKHNNWNIAIETYPPFTGLPPLPLLISYYKNLKELGAIRMRMLYEHINPNGDVGLVNGQRVNLELRHDDKYSGTYQADNKTIQWENSTYRGLPGMPVAPAEPEESHLAIDLSPFDQNKLFFPFKTNIFDQLGNMVGDVGSDQLTTPLSNPRG